MSVAYTSTSFGTSATTSTPSGPARHQRHSSSSSRSSTTLAGPAGQLPFPATAARSPRRNSEAERMMRAQYDAIGAFFGGGRPTAERNEPREQPQTASARPTPPEYDTRSEADSLPTYVKIEEYDAAFNRKLFIYGFLFFPLWIVGIIAPFVKPLHDPTRDNRSKEDQEVDYASMRTVEMRWAKRCAAALLGFIILVIVAVVVGVTVAKQH
ncbi:uncharacterized protein FOMMEDRAFT_145594 [Fomitiporia mediterranea MF3/22]|uniref:uncharacterized protein n=1 Tax=Fomitiporia mediterranea (strain MF3/22) TaxID=694068 RepID=UPI000440953E|nr:uncharacterized protein FOMMEDRAFT_145594 [Fomitiporia mediterranea MF3/22]EJD04863.1 hypothetical protein FOMMEDRAFT_145594 [Fomitiporia mediterranea MF3/22]